MKKTHLIVSLSAFSLVSVSAFAGPFDVTNAEYQSGLKYETKLGDPYGQINVKSYLSNNIIAMMQGMERYAEEMDDWYAHLEFEQDKAYQENRNADLTDNRAYAIVKNSGFYADDDGSGNSGRWYRHGDLISGSDWNNNGKIDVLESSAHYRYYGVEVLVR